jgi:transglutaminase-like putative cysteine protease
MRLFIEHRTDYRFSEPQARLVQMLRLTPSSYEGQNVVDWRIDVDCDARLKPARDGFGNEVTMLYVDGPIEHISLTVTGEVLTDDRAGIVAGAPEPLPPLVFMQTTRLTRSSPAIAAFASDIAAKGGTRLDQAHRLNEALHRRLRFDPALPAPDRDAATIFEEGHGIGQDFAHVFIATAREIGFPARYVSGHLYEAGDGQPHRRATHGWAEAYVEGFGWIGFDPVHEICPHDAYVRVAIGLDYHDAAPISGARTGGGQELLEVGVRVGLSQAQTQS